tara:strand:- start:164 stop:424 length:261 start_codon:yes stop_codon:yes gene_type:complete
MIIKLEKKMNRFRELLLDYPFIAMGIIFPFALAITLGLISFFIEVIVPVLFAIGLTYWIYHTLIGNSFRNQMRKPFTYINTKYYSM